MPIEGESFARSILDVSVPSKASPQYFEMFGHRGIWHQGWKAVAYHPPGTPFEADKWELFHLDRDFSEVDDVAEKEPQRRDRGSPVSHYVAPFEFTGKLSRVTVVMHDDQKLDGEGVGKAEMARQ